MKYHFWFSKKQMNRVAVMKEEAPEAYEIYMELQELARALGEPDDDDDYINTVVLNGQEVVYTEMRGDGVQRPSGLWDDYIYLGGMDSKPVIKRYKFPQTKAPTPCIQ